MFDIIQFIRGFLTKRGLEVRRVVTPRLRFEDFILRQARTARGLQPPSIHVFDDDPRLQVVLLNAFGSARVYFHPWASPLQGAAFEQIEPGVEPAGKFWAAINLEQFPLQTLIQTKLWVRSAEVIVICSTLKSLNSCSQDFVSIVTLCQRLGLFLYDVSIPAQQIISNATNNRVLLIFSRRDLTKESEQAKKNRKQRLDEAQAFFPAPLAQRDRFRWLTGRGSFGFEAGVFNPGAISDRGAVFLLCRGEQISWPLQKLSEKKHFSGWRPFLLRLDESENVTGHTELKYNGTMDQTRIRVEDFRLFQYKDQIISNHSVITLPGDRAPRDQPVRLELQRARVAFSSLAIDDNSLNFIGFPKLDFPTRDIEKNWAMMTVGEELYLIYSIFPYRILRLTKWPGLEFTMELSREISMPFAQDGQLVRNSINPVMYDEHHFLHLVHKVYSSKQYVFWAMLIDKRTLCPAYISNRPVVRSGDSLAASILYVCSVVAGPDSIQFFGGINDCGSGVWTVDRAELDRSWQPLEYQPNPPYPRA